MPLSALADRIDAALPQTQCQRCGYPYCRRYAQAIAAGEAPINRCPPGGAQGIERLSAILGAAVLPLDAAFGIEGPRAMAVIDEAWCIGCTLCLDACPTDAILGINKQMHTVIEAHCTGCELCLPVCPVDCIAMRPETPGRSGWLAWSAAQASDARDRYRIHSNRRRLDKRKGPETPSKTAAPPDDARKRSVIEAALAKARAKASDSTDPR